MSPHHQTGEEDLDRAALYALDALPERERAEYEAHLQDCPGCAEEALAFGRVASVLAHLAPQAEPPPRLKTRLFEAIREAAGGAERPSARGPQVWKRWDADAAPSGRFLLRAEEGEWEPTGLSGITVRRLFVDPAADRVSMLVRMAPGTAYLPHRHSGPEECYVLDGDLSVAGVRLHPGDYERAAPDSVHGIQSTEGGCLLLITSSLHDQILSVQDD
jgi:anti-sigma factor ChrR (cupin superfamily)